MYLISNIENLGTTVGLTGLETPKTSSRDDILCNRCLKPILIGDEYLKARSSKRTVYFYHLSCAMKAFQSGEVQVSSKAKRNFLHQKEYFLKRQEWLSSLSEEEYEEYLKVKDKHHRV